MASNSLSASFGTTFRLSNRPLAPVKSVALRARRLYGGRSTVFYTTDVPPHLLLGGGFEVIWLVPAPIDSISGEQARFIHLVDLEPCPPFIVPHIQKVSQQ
jgi:hypothetical protein